MPFLASTTMVWPTLALAAALTVGWEVAATAPVAVRAARATAAIAGVAFMTARTPRRPHAFPAPWHPAGMARIPISDPAFEYDDTDPEGFRCGMVRVGKVVGAKLTGASVYELPPGQTLCPYHYEYGEEEWALVLEGSATLRTPQGTEPLGPMELAFFPTGPDGAHSLANDTTETVRVLMFSNYAAV